MHLVPVQLGQQTPEGFYIAQPSEIYEGLIDPQIMTLAQLDAEIEKGLEVFKQFHPEEKSWFDSWLPVLVAVGVAGVAVAMVAAPIAAAGAATAATQAAPAAAAAGGAAASQPITAAAAVGAAQKGAALVKAGGLAYKVVTGKNDADRLIQASHIVSQSPDVTTAAEQIINAELAARGRKVQTKAAQEALRERVRREQELYAEYMRRQGYQLQREITADIVPGTLPEKPATPDWTAVLAVATPFILLAMGQR